MRHPVTILFGYLVVFLYGMSIVPFIKNPRAHSDCLLAFVVHLGISGTLIYFFGWPAWLLTQVIPYSLPVLSALICFTRSTTFPG